MTNWMSVHWWKLLTAAAIFISGYAILTNNVREMKPKVEANSKAIVENEKCIIKLDGKMDAMQIQQSAYHSTQTEKLDEILEKLPDK